MDVRNWTPRLKHSLRAQLVPQKDPVSPPSIFLRFGRERGVEVGYGPFTQTVLPMLKGDLTLPELVKAVQMLNPGITQDRVKRFLQGLAENGRIEDATADTAGLSTHDLEQFDRNISYLSLQDNTGEMRYHFQKMLINSHVTVIELGALGSSVLDLLARHGVRHFRGIDCDKVDKSNLIRGRYNRSDVGKLKTRAAARMLRKIDRSIQFEPVVRRINGAADIVDILVNAKTGIVARMLHTLDRSIQFEPMKELVRWALSILKSSPPPDLVIFCADEPASIADWMNQASLETGIAYIKAGYQGPIASFGPPVIPGKTDCYRCLMGGDPGLDAPPELAWLNERANRRPPSNAAHTDFVASRMAWDATRYLIGLKPWTLGRVIIFDPSSESFRFPNTPRARICHARGREHPDG